MKAVRKMSVAAALLALSAGAWAQDAKPAAPKSDQDSAVDAQKKALEALAGRQEVRVTIEARNATVQWVVEEFRRQVPYINFDLDPKGWPEEFRVGEFIVRNEPWRSALTAFLAKAEGSIDEESPTLIRVSRPPRVTFAFKDAPIKTVIDLIARISGANVILHPDVQGSVTMSVNNVPWNAVLETVVKTVGDYTTVKERYDIIRIVPVRELLKQMETKVYKLRFIQPPASYRAQIEEGKYFKGKAIIPPTTTKDRLDQFTLLGMLRGLSTSSAGGQGLGSIDYDPESNTLSVKDTKVVLNRMDELIKMLDREPEQVMIDVKFISTINEDLLNFGTNWEFSGAEGMGATTEPQMPTALGKITRLPFGLGREVPGADQFFMTNYDMRATFRAFKRDKFTKLIQGPTLSVLDSTEATIFVGEQVPYAESKAQTNQFGGLEFTIQEGGKSPVKIGFQLLVIPRIIPESNKVVMTVIPVNEFLSGTGTGQGLVAGFERFVISNGVAGAQLSIDLPRIASTTLVTRLMIESGRTAVLGGLVNERLVFDDKKVPLLGDIPLLGYFFKQRNDSIRREHLLIFITPRIVRSSSQAEESLRSLLREHADRERRELEDARLKDAQDRLRIEQENREAEKASELKNP